MWNRARQLLILRPNPPTCTVTLPIGRCHQPMPTVAVYYYYLFIIITYYYYLVTYFSIHWTIVIYSIMLCLTCRYCHTCTASRVLVVVVYML